MAPWSLWLQIGPASALAVLALAAFTAATLLPMPSEAWLLALAAAWPEWVAAGWLVATLANSAGGMTTYAVGRLVGAGLHACGQRPAAGARLQRAARASERALARWRTRLGRHGSRLTALGFLPVAGEAIVLAAGAMALPAASCWAWQLLGRGLRYALTLLPMLWFA
jgi:membrane protein YqaA with SNARE-associated domain